MPKAGPVKDTSPSRLQKFFLPAIFLLAVGLSFGVTQLLTASSKSAEVQPCAKDETCVSLYANRADPGAVSVINGTYVQFNSADGKSHQLVLGKDSKGGHSEHGGAIDSGVFKGDEAYRVRFTRDGAYVFTDKLNPKVSVVVVVYTPGKDYSITR